MRVACIQPQVFKDRNKCYHQIEALLKELLEENQKCDIVCLPERWVPYYRDPNKNIQKERGNDYFFVKNLAKEYNIKILSGAIWEKRNILKKPIITCYFFDELKIFALNKLYDFAILICFDMAFFETPRLAIENGADVLFSPTQIREDGMNNWEIYLKARALENRVPVIACNTFGSYLQRKFIGHSKIISFHKGNISPSKLRIVEGPKNSSGFIFDEIDLSFPKKIRKIRLGEKVDKNKINVKIINN